MHTNYAYIIADHIRAACFIIADGVQPSGKQRGYVLRRLIRRSAMSAHKLGINIANRVFFQEIVESVCSIYDGVYENISSQKELIIDTLLMESKKFLNAMNSGKKQWDDFFRKTPAPTENMLTDFAWSLYQSHGVPFEISEDEISKKSLSLNTDKLHDLLIHHQQDSAQLSKGMFKSGLAEDTIETRKLHTATHLLHSALRTLYGTAVKQVGSAIQSKKARFDATIPESQETLNREKIQNLVQEYIDTCASVRSESTTLENAQKSGAIGLFGEKYPDIVTIYTITTPDNREISKEFCGGPHIENTKMIGKFELLKIKSIGSGRKRFEFSVHE